MNHTLKLTTAASLVALGTAVAHPHTDPAPASSPYNGDWCTALKDFGKLYKNDSAFIQQLTLFGRFQAQYASIDGNDINGNSFVDGYDTIRRFRMGAKIKFLDNFELLGRANLVTDSRHNLNGVRDFGYQNWDELKISYTLMDVAGLDSLVASYGRHKISMGHESHTSSKKIKTVERSAISNRIYSNRYTGLKLAAKKGDWKGTLGFLSLDMSPGIGSWDHGNAIYLSSAHKVSSGDLVFDFFYNLDTSKRAGTKGYDEVGVGYKWAASVSYETEINNWDLVLNVIYGDNGDTTYAGRKSRSGNFYGFVVMPSTYIIEDKLEFVARYAFQGSSENQGIRTNSRYFRATDHGGAVNGGRGDSHHSIYAGLNYFLCGHNSKVMVGVEYETLDTPNAVGTKNDANATTLWAAYRMYF